jgi:hypothetical protein
VVGGGGHKAGGCGVGAEGGEQEFYAGSLVVAVSGTTAYADGETNIPATSKLSPTKDILMGDRSPKSNQKNASQKQAKNDVANNKKQALVTSQQATKAKAAALKKK